MVNNITNLTHATSFYDIVKFENDITNNILGDGLIWALFIIFTMAFLNKRINPLSFEKSVLVSAFICFLMALILSSIGLISWGTIITFLVITIIDGLYVAFIRTSGDN